MKYACETCSHVYDPALGVSDGGIGHGIPFEQRPDEWECPICGVRKEEFTPAEE